MKVTIPKTFEEIPREINLIELFPLSRWFPVRFTIKYLLILVAAWVSFEFTASMIIQEYLPEPLAGDVILYGRLLAIGGFLAYIVRFILSTLRGNLRRMYIKDGALMVRRGVLLKNRGTFALARITDTYIEQDFFDLMFNTATVHVMTPTQTSGDFVKLVGFSKESADGIQRYVRQLTELISSHHAKKSKVSA